MKPLAVTRLEILFEDNHLLVANKPAGIATMGTVDSATLHSLACDYLRHKYNKPGNVYVGVVSRLDTVTSGVIVLARTSKAASRLVPQFAKASGVAATKVYLAIVEGQLNDDGGTLSHHVYKDDAAHRMRVATSAKHDGSKLAELAYVTLRRSASATLVAVRLMTGRKHQIRLQFAQIGHPLLGDRKYGAKTEFGPAVSGVPGVALHSWRLQITHPTLQHAMAFGVQPPRVWKTVASELPVPADVSSELCEMLKIPHFVPLCG